MKEAEKLSLGGRTYTHIGVGPLRQDLFVMMHARHAGLVGLTIYDHETPEEFAARILDLILCSGRALLILGGLLLPDGRRPEDWTEDMAYETAAALGAITDEDGKKAVQQEILSVLLGFFESGLGSWIASGRSSAAGSDDGAATTSASPAAPGVTGRASSGSSPTTTPSAQFACSAG